MVNQHCKLERTSMVDQHGPFVAQPNCQQLLATLWYDGFPGWRRRHWAVKLVTCFIIGLLFPVFSLIYLLAPKSALGRFIKKPFIKFICHTASYLTFLFLLLLASQHIARTNLHMQGPPPTIVEWMILPWVLGFIWAEIKEMWDGGFTEYIHDWWNLMDFAMNSLYLATISLKIVAYVKYNSSRPREEWEMWHPTLIAEALFAIANIFSSLRLISLFTANSHLGPLQISLGRMVLDILKFLFIYCLDHADIEWKFARTKLWMSYFDEGGTLPPPFNIVPSPKSVWYLLMWLHTRLCQRGQPPGEDSHKCENLREFTERHADSLIQNQHYQELKQDISSFRYEVLDLLGNRRPPRRNYSSSSETTRDDGNTASEDDSESGDGGGGGTGEKSQKSSKGVSFMVPLEEDSGAGSNLSVTALVRSISGMPSSETAGGQEEGPGWGLEEEDEDGKPKSNGLKTTVMSATSATMLASTSFTSSLARARSRLQQMSTPSGKTDSFKRLSYLFSRSKRKAPPVPLPLQTSPSFTISDGLLRPLGSHGHADFGHVTRSEPHLHEVGRSVDSIGAAFSPSRRTNGRDSLLATLPRPPPCPCQSLHCASNMSESSSRLLDSSEDVFQGSGGMGGIGGAEPMSGSGRGTLMGGWVGPCDDVIEDSCEVIEESVTTQL
ncbi:hypothetical protein WMY93_014684 [Mugilogobius chulae]|uniref:Ion transport domain-containing protein n=1 Tax=Mugilogobius chulae TaxID=88201 RepID=A0AAW0P1T1_9GOBI